MTSSSLMSAEMYSRQHDKAKATHGLPQSQDQATLRPRSRSDHFQAKLRKMKLEVGKLASSNKQRQSLRMTTVPLWIASLHVRN